MKILKDWSKIKMSTVQKIPISDVRKLLADGKQVKVKTANGEFKPVVNYFEKGKLPTYLVKLDNGYTIKVSAKHRFFTSQGWLSMDELKPNITKIYCDTAEFCTVIETSYIGNYNIVDIEVDSDEHSYFGNGMLNHNSGKSLLTAHALASTQKLGGIGVLIDTEAAVSKEFMQAIGVDTSKLLYVPTDSVEKIFEAMETIIEKVRLSSKDKYVTIVVDSIAGASTKKELEADYAKDGYATDKAIMISKAMRKITNMIAKQKITVIFTNQLRQKMNAMPFSDPWCVDPFTTKIKIRYNMSKYIEEELTLYEFAERFLDVNDFVTPATYDLHDMGICVLTLDTDGNEIYKPINYFVVKQKVDSYFTDDQINVSANHRFIENGETIFAKNHPDFNQVFEPLHICDIEVDELHSFLANGRLNHNTTSGGKALGFHASVRLRLSTAKTIKVGDEIIGIEVKCKVIKNRIGPPLRTATFNILFDRGVDTYGAWLAVLKEYSLVKQGGAWYTYVDIDTGEEIKFQSADFVALLNSRTEIKEQMYNRICDCLILKYKKNDEAEVIDNITTGDITDDDVD